MLQAVIVSSIIWLYTGWDGTIEQLFTGRYGEGIHWSTLQTSAIFFYVLTLNMQTGGLNSMEDLVNLVRQDLHAIIYANFPFQKRFKEIRNGYKQFVVDNLRGCIFGFFVIVLGLAVFENIWVPLYDYLHFGNWMWPIYYLSFKSWYPFAAPLGRNVMVLVVTLLGTPAIFYLAAWSGPNDNPHRRYSIRWRFDAFWILILLPSALILWLVWILGAFPHPVIGPSQLTVADVIKDQLPANFTLSSTTWLFPKQVFFPQTSYTFYPASVYLQPYIDKQIYGFYVNDPFIHFLNVLTKYMTMVVVAYPAMLRVKVNP